MKARQSALTAGIAAAGAAGALASSTASATRLAKLGCALRTIGIISDVDQLDIASQSAPGARGSETCRSITGRFGIADNRGWYCRSTGRMHFMHKNSGSPNAERISTSSLSHEVPGWSLCMGGTMTVLDAAFGDFGDRTHSATKERDRTQRGAPR